MSSAPESDLSKPTQMFKSCLSCRLVSGGGLVLSGAYVFNAALKVIQRGGPVSIGPTVQVVFAACLAAFGVVVIAEPVGKAQRHDK